MALASSEVKFVLVLAAVYFWFSRTIDYLLRRNPRILHSEVRKCHELLRTTTLEKRAALNQNLAVAFGIENGFTTTNEKVHHAFREHIKTFLVQKNDDETRQKLIEIISESIRRTSRRVADAKQPILLVRIVRTAFFRAVVAVFFSDAEEISDEDIVFITTRMDSLWHESKSPWKIFQAHYVAIWSSIVREREELHEKIRSIFPSLTNSMRMNPSENPLNVLLPAFMGLFQVVLRGFLELRFRSTEIDRLDYQYLLEKFLRDPTGRWYVEENGVSVQEVVAETLRLYPPTRRISKGGNCCG